LTFRILVSGIVGVALAIGLCGCWLPLISLAPLAISAAEGVGSTVFGVAEGVVVVAHQGSGQARDQDQDHPGEDEMDREDRCDDLPAEVPGVIELRKSAAGAPEYRELQLGGSLDQPQWIAKVDDDTNAGGWRPAGNFLQMSFTPPLASPIPATSSNYLAYRDMQTESSVAEDRLAPLSLNFGTAVGTFTSNGRTYQYALTHTLPCFSSPP
jgi:hypothetical protein